MSLLEGNEAPHVGVKKKTCFLTWQVNFDADLIPFLFPASIFKKKNPILNHRYHDDDDNDNDNDDDDDDDVDKDDVHDVGNDVDDGVG